ncbi:MAG: branched-chain amino acid ABC transporter permease [Elstera sp.]
MLTIWLGLLFDGLAYGMLLYLMSLGLAVTLGLMGFVHLAHGAYAALGGYLAVALMRDGGWPFWAVLPAGFLAMALLGAGLERAVLWRLYARPPLDQMLFCIGFLFLVIASITAVWGGGQQTLPVPQSLSGQTGLAGVEIGRYRLFLLLLGGGIILLLHLGLTRTRWGARLRAAVDLPEVARGLGVPVNRLFAATFALGCGLAGLGGVLSVPLVGLDPAFPLKYLVLYLIIVSVGGLGSLGGPLVVALGLGVLDIFGKYYLPEAGGFLIYAAMVALLLRWPNGLFAGQRR